MQATRGRTYSARLQDGDCRMHMVYSTGPWAVGRGTPLRVGLGSCAAGHSLNAPTRLFTGFCVILPWAILNRMLGQMP